jgi:hypothetical protein
LATPLDATERRLLARVAVGDGGAADALAELWIARGDKPRGRFLQVERALMVPSRDNTELLASRRHLLRKHRERWWAPAVAAGFGPDALAFVHGFVATPLVLGAAEPDDELRRLSPLLYRDLGASGCSHRAVHAARQSTAELDHGAAVLLKTSPSGDDRLAALHVRELDDPLPVNRLASHGHAMTRAGKAFVLPGGVDLARVLGVRAGDDPMSLRAAGARLGVGFAVAVALETCRALAPLHARGERHGRLTPENIILDDAGRAAVVSLYPIEWTEPRVAWRYEWAWHLSPEQLPGPEHDPRTDVFALGLVMATLVDGRHPASASANELDLMLALRDRRLALPNLPPALAAVLGRALAHRDDRYADATAFGNALVAAANSAGVAAGPAVIADALRRLAASRGLRG